MSFSKLFSLQNHKIATSYKLCYSNPITRIFHRPFSLISKGRSPVLLSVNKNLHIPFKVFISQAKAKPKLKDPIPVRTIVQNVWSHVPQSVKPKIKVYIVLSLTLLFLSKIVNIAIPGIFKLLIDYLNGKQELLNLTSVTGALLTASTVLLACYFSSRFSAALFQEVRNALASRADQIAIRTVTRSSFKHVHDMDLSFHTAKKMGSLTSTIDRGTRGVGQMLRSALLNIFPAAFEFVGVTGIMLYLCGVEYAAAVAGCFGTYAVWTIHFTKRRNKFLVQKNAAERETKDQAHDSIVNYETVKYFNNETYETDQYDAHLARLEKANYFNNETYETEQYDAHLARLEKANVRMTDSLATLNAGQQFILSGGVACVMMLACGDIVSGAKTVGDLVMVNQWMFQLAVPLNFLGSSYRDMVNALVDARELYGLTQAKPQIKSLDGAPDLLLPSPFQASIVFDNVHFQYEPDKPILNGLSFELPAGKKIAIVGGSGSGKSTIVRLLYRLYDPVSGHVFINSQDTRQVSLESVRHAVAVVPQDCGLFNSTVLHNVHYGNLNATIEEVHRAAKMAEIHDVIMRFPRGYEQRVGDRGSQLSGGEKQRVAIARAILKNAPIFVYDEATSSLDSVTEDNIMRALARVARDRTTIVIAHRLSTIVDADEILVLDKGKVAERGRHFGLLRQSGSLYAHLWNKQHEKALIHEKEQQEIGEVAEGESTKPT